MELCFSNVPLYHITTSKSARGYIRVSHNFFGDYFSRFAMSSPQMMKPAHAPMATPIKNAVIYSSLDKARPTGSRCLLPRRASS